ncbi:type VI secretion system Vgr family protein [Paraburkholderia xenovorans]|jgi:type VI secretion system secreted protein VgrG
MAWNTQPRTLEVAGDALPAWRNAPLFVASRLRGTEKLGRLYRYEVDVSTVEAPGLYVDEMHRLVDLNRLVGKRLTVKIAVEGSGTWVQGAAQAGSPVNNGAGVREISGVIAGAKCLGADDRRVFYRFRLRPWLWLATLNRENRVFLDRTVEEMSRDVLTKYPFPVKWMLGGPGYGRKAYPKRDYQRQFWESDWAFLNRLWQEWGITFHFDGMTLVLRDGASFGRHGGAYQTIRYLDRDGQRIDEEHIHELKVLRGLTTGKVAVTDYDYTQATARFGRTIAIHRDATFDNAEEYIQADYAQPLQGAMGLHGDRNDDEFEADHLARVRAEAYRCRSLRVKGVGNLRGLMTGRTFFLEGFPVEPANDEYLVTGTKIEIVNNDTITQGGVGREYTCRTKFTAQRANQVYRTPLTAEKPRAFAETAIVSGYEDSNVYTDAMARLKLWFNWDRVGERNGNATCWVPLSQVWQGPRYGALWIPRVGDHVHVGYVNSDPDRPFVLASHTTDRNQAPWDLAANHALSGWRSRDLGSQGRASNAVVTDDTPGRLQVQVTSDYANSRFVAGYNVRINGDRGRQEARGEGIEIATDSHAVMRANRGVLITSEMRAGASAPVKDMGETVQRLEWARQQHEDLSQLAQKHDAQAPGSSQGDVVRDIGTQNDAIRGGQKSADNPSPEMTRPDMVLASAAAIATTATESTHMASVNDHAVTAGRDYSVSVGRSYHASVRGAISLFAYQQGMKFIAAKGRVDIQAQGDGMTLAALKDVTISSTDGKIIITAAKEVWIGAGGSYIQINGSGIINGSPGPILEKTALWDVPDPDARIPSFAPFCSGTPTDGYSHSL